MANTTTRCSYDVLTVHVVRTFALFCPIVFCRCILSRFVRIRPTLSFPTTAAVKTEMEQMAQSRRQSKFHAALPSWWFKVTLMGSLGKSNGAAMQRLQKNKAMMSTMKNDHITDELLQQDIAAFQIQRLYVAYRLKKSRKRNLEFAEVASTCLKSNTFSNDDDDDDDDDDLPLFKPVRHNVTHNPGDERMDNEGVNGIGSVRLKRRSLMPDGTAMVDEVVNDLQRQEQTIEQLLQAVGKLTSQLAAVTSAVTRTEANVSRLAGGGREIHESKGDTLDRDIRQFQAENS